MPFSSSSPNQHLQDLIDQLNGQTALYGVSGNNKLQTGVPPFSVYTQQTATTLNFHIADEKGNPGNAIAIPKSIQLYAGLTTSATAPTTDDLPSSGSFGWHLNTSNGAYYWALNDAGTVVLPNFVSIAGTLTTTQHGDLSGAGTTMHDFPEISGAITAAQHGNLTTGTLHNFTVISGTINDAQHGARAGSTLHPAATTSVNGFMASTDKTSLDSITTTGTASTVANGTAFYLNGNLIINQRRNITAPAVIGPAAATYGVNEQTMLNTVSALANDLRTQLLNLGGLFF